MGWDRSLKFAVADAEAPDLMGCLVASHAVPVAAVGLWLPRDDAVRIVEGFLDLEEDFLVLWVAELGERRVKKGGEEKAKAEEFWSLHYVLGLNNLIGAKMLR